MKGRLGEPSLLSYVHIMKQVIIGKIIWYQGDKTFYGPFETHDEWEKWVERCMVDDDGEIEEIGFEIMYRVPKDLATTE